MNDRLCILIVTCPRHIAIARLTEKLVRRYWPDHPQLYLCGFDAPETNVLPLRADPADWMAIVFDAAEVLRAKGYGAAYLVLDDQGPIDRCHSVHLNETIPRWLGELDASYISIRGWDHRRNSAGRSLGRSWLGLQQQDSNFLWRWALHPALWRLEVLTHILRVIRPTAMRPEDRSAWAFEVQAGHLKDEIPAAWNERTFRVCGRRMTYYPMPAAERMIRHGLDAVVRAIDRRLHDRKFRASRLPVRASRLAACTLRTDAVYYRGPYPMYYSGFLKKGRFNRHLQSALRRARRFDLLSEIEVAVSTVVRPQNSIRRDTE